jgi:hypothetical protein
MFDPSRNPIASHYEIRYSCSWDRGCELYASGEFPAQVCDNHEFAITYLTLQGISIALIMKLSTDGHM